MTSGERMVWAAEFVRARGMGCRSDRAVEMASAAVYAMHSSIDMSSVAPDALAMLQDVLGNGADR